MDMTAFAFFSTAHTFTALPALAAACSSSRDALSQDRYLHSVTEHTYPACAGGYLQHDSTCNEGTPTTL